MYIIDLTEWCTYTRHLDFGTVGRLFIIDLLLYGLKGVYGPRSTENLKLDLSLTDTVSRLMWF